MNPSMTVYLLFVSKSEFSNNTREIVRHLLKYRNIKIRHIQPDNYVKNTPLEAWYAKGALKKSRWPNSHMSDILRYLTLWKYGGIYLDLDVVVTTSLEDLTNFAGAEDWDDVAAGVIGFDMSELGRRIADACVRDLKKNFRGDLWGNNGPGVITRTLQKFCATKYVSVGRERQDLGIISGYYYMSLFCYFKNNRYPMDIAYCTFNESLKTLFNSW